MSAQRASAPVRFVRLAAAAVILILATAVVVRLAGRRGGPAPAPVAPPPEDRVVDLKERVLHQEFREGRIVAEIRGASFFRGPDGRNHLTGSVDVENRGPAGEVLSRLSADEVVYDPDSLRFTVVGHVRVEAGGVVLEGDAFDFDKAAGLFGTTGGGRFASETMNGRAPEISFRESAGEVRLGGGFRVEIGKAGTGPATVLSGDSFVYERRERRGRVDGRAALESSEFRGESEVASFVASEDESSLQSAVFERGAKVVFRGKEPSGEGSGEIQADSVAIAFAGDPPGGFSIKASGRSGLSFRSAADRTETVLAPTMLLSFDRVNGLWTWSASGGIRAEVTAAGRPGRTLEGEEAVFDAAQILHVSGPSGRPAVADSAEARIEAPSISVATAAEGVLATGGVAGVLKRGEGRRRIGFFSPLEDVSFSCQNLDLRPEISTSFMTRNVLVRQGTDVLRADELELAGDAGRMSGGGGVAITLTEAAEGQVQPRTIEIGGQEMAYRPDLRTLTLSSKAYVRLQEASLEAERVSAVVGREGKSVESLSGALGVTVTKGRFQGRAEAAAYDAATGRITLTGSPVLTDGKGGSARGGKLTFDLADDKILIENEGPGRATTVVRS